SAGLPRSPPQAAPRVPRFEGVPPFSAIRADLGLQSATPKMTAAPDLGLSKIINQQAASLVTRMPKFSTVNVAGPAFSAIRADLGLQSAIRADLGLQSAISKMIAAPDLGLFDLSTAAVAASHQNLLRHLGRFSA